MTSIVLVCLLELPLEYVIKTSAVTKHITAAAAFALSSAMTSCILFLPKAVTILLPDAPVLDSKGMPSAKVNPSSKKQILEAMHKIMSTKGGASANDEEADIAKNGISLDNFRKLTPDEKVVLCNEQILLWRGRLMQANEYDSHQSSSQTTHLTKRDADPPVLRKDAVSDKPAMIPASNWTGTHAPKPTGYVPAANGATDDDVQVFSLEK